MGYENYTGNSPDDAADILSLQNLAKTGKYECGDIDVFYM